MSEHDADDLSRWDDDALVRALRAPGTAAELADQEQYVAAFREARGASSTVRSLPRRAAGRLGAGGGAVVVTIALTSGMAAAYTGHLPDSVQQIAHSVIGAPAPGSGRPQPPSAGTTTHGHGVAPTGPTATSSPTGGTTSSPTSSPTTGSTHWPTGGSTSTGHHGPSSGPTSDPSSTATSTPTATAGTPGGMTASGDTHRAGVGETVTLTSILTTTDGTPLTGYPVVLQVRGPAGWQPVADATTDASGAATATTPPLTRSAKFRWHTDHHVHSTGWIVQMVPTVSVTATVGGSTTQLAIGTVGAEAGDRVQVLRWARHHASFAGRGSLDATGSLTWSVATPARRTVYVVRLKPTGAHTAAKTRVVVVPPRVGSVGIVATTHRIPVGQSLTVSGVVRAADGSALPGRLVHLQVRGPRGWFGAGRATTDASGDVAITTPAAQRTVSYRLRVGQGRHSVPWRVAMVPTLSVTSRPDGSGADVVGSAVGGRAGDRVVLLRREHGRLVTVRQGRLAADGTVVFTVARRRRAATYVVRLVATRRHTAATARTTVAGTG